MVRKRKKKNTREIDFSLNEHYKVHIHFFSVIHINMFFGLYINSVFGLFEVLAWTMMVFFWEAWTYNLYCYRTFVKFERFLIFFCVYGENVLGCLIEAILLHERWIFGFCFKKWNSQICRSMQFVTMKIWPFASTMINNFCCFSLKNCWY